MKTKSFLLATAGSTVDGRKIDDKMIDEMVESYDPQTYGAQINIEHINGFSGEGPFRAYGDVLELTAGEVDVNFKGKTEKRKAMFGVFDVTDDAKKLNDARQKMYPSIEIEPNFGGKGFAYCMGVALTDTPAAIATEKMKFNRNIPGAIHLSREEPAVFELADDDGQAGAGFIGSLKTILDEFAAKFKPTEQPKPDVKTGDADEAAFDFAALRPLFEKMSETFSADITALREQIADSDQRFAQLKKQLDETPDTSRFSKRAAATGAKSSGDFVY